MFACLHAPGNFPLLLNCAGHFSPLIEETSPDTVTFDVRGLDRIFGRPSEIAAKVVHRVGIEGNVAIASNPDAAVHAARGIRGVTVIAPGREAAALAPLPLFLLGGSPEFAKTLDLWGLRTFGDFAALPPAGVAARLGDEGIHMQQLARGEGHRQLHLRTDPLEFRQELELDCPVDLLEPLLLVLGGMLKNLCARLEAHSLAANEVRVWLKVERTHECNPEHETVLRLPVPMTDSKVFLKLLQLDWNRRPPQSAVEKIRLELNPVAPRTMQHGLFLPASPEPQKLEITLARIRALVGAENLGTPELLDTHRPDSFLTAPFDRGSLLFGTENEPRPEGAFSLKLAMRRFRPRRAAQVWCSGDGRPVRIFSEKEDRRIIACAGPWLTSGDWWNPEAWDHEEWDVEISSGRLLRIHRDRRMSRWFLEASYD